MADLAVAITEAVRDAITVAPAWHTANDSDGGLR